LRPKYSDADLERWRTEVAEFTRLGGDGEKYNPEWARAICWTKRDVKCGCKPGPISITVTHQ
jgi:hypothetical protein